MLASQGVNYDPTIEATEYSTILGLVASGQGIARVPAAVLAFQPPGLSYIKVENSSARVPLYLMARADDQRSVVSTSFTIAEQLAPLLAKGTLPTEQETQDQR